MAHTEIERPFQSNEEPKKFSNPYLVEGIETQQVVADISVEDYNLIKSIRLKNGTLTGVVCIMWKKLADECRLRGITDFKDIQEFENLVMNSRLVPIDEYTKLVSEASANVEKATAEGTLLKKPAKAKKI